MSEVKALFPIGKTQWRKWNDAQRTAFNEAREAGVAYMDAIAEANAKHTKNMLDILHDVAEAAETVANVVTTVTPVVGVAKTVVKAATKKGK